MKEGFLIDAIAITEFNFWPSKWS